jgi:hypothetical protein
MRLAHEDKVVLGNINPKASSAKALELIKSDAFWNRLEKLVGKIEVPTKIIGKIKYLIDLQFKLDCFFQVNLKQIMLH